MALKHKDNENGNVLHYAVESGDSALARYILKQSRDSDCKELINLHKSDGDTPLHIASEKGFTDIVKILCRYGAKIEAFNRNHETAIYVAAKNSHEKVVAFLANRQGLTQRRF
jgi:ankyrin repeat protein